MLKYINDIVIYHTGDSDLIPEMNDLKPDVALVPGSGTYVMTAKEAAKAIEKIKIPRNESAEIITNFRLARSAQTPPNKPKMVDAAIRAAKIPPSFVKNLASLMRDLFICCSPTDAGNCP